MTNHQPGDKAVDLVFKRSQHFNEIMTTLSDVSVHLQSYKVYAELTDEQKQLLDEASSLVAKASFNLGTVAGLELKKVKQ